MNKCKYLKSILIALFCITTLTTSSICIEKVIAQPTSTPVQQSQTQQFCVKPLDIVNSPKSYINKTVIMNAKFDKFSTLGLDYKPAFKSSEDYITFLIKRDDTEYNIPLSEMKLFLKRDVAEKFIDLKTDDLVEIKGIVFSDALGDAWIDVKELKLKQKAPENKK